MLSLFPADLIFFLYVSNEFICLTSISLPGTRRPRQSVNSETCSLQQKSCISSFRRLWKCYMEERDLEILVSWFDNWSIYIMLRILATISFHLLLPWENSLLKTIFFLLNYSSFPYCVIDLSLFPILSCRPLVGYSHFSFCLTNGCRLQAF